MSVLIVGMSHKSAPIELLERASLDTDAAVKLSHRALETSSVTEAAVISTCNRSGSTGPSRRSRACSPSTPSSTAPSSPSTSTSITTTPPWRTCSRSPPASTR